MFQEDPTILQDGGPCYPGHIGTAKVGGPASLCGTDGPNILQAEYT